MCVERIPVVRYGHYKLRVVNGDFLFFEMHSHSLPESRKHPLKGLPESNVKSVRTRLLLLHVYVYLHFKSFTIKERNILILRSLFC